MSLNTRRRAAGDALIAASRRQVVLDCAGAQGEAAEVAAGNLRRVLVERGGEVSQFGVRISNARITGQLDLSACRVDFPVYFKDCRFTEPIVIEGSDLHSLFLVGTPQADGTDPESSVPGILGNGVRIRRDLLLSHTLITGAHSTTSSLSRSAAVWLTEAEIGGRIIAVGTLIDTSADRAIQADRCQVTGDIRLIQGFRANAEIRLIGAQLGGSLDLAGCRLVPRNGRAVDLAEATVGGSLFINDSPAHAPLIEGRLEMGRVSINGRVLIRRATLNAPAAGVGRHHYNSKDPAQRLAIVAQGASIQGELSIDENTSVDGGITFAGAAIGGGIYIDGATIQNAGDIALDFTHARVGSTLSALGANIQGTVDLDGAEVAGPLGLAKAEISRPAGRYCLTAVRAVVHGDVKLSDAKVGGTYPVAIPGASGGIGFRGAELRGMFDAERAQVISPGDTAVNLHQARISGNLRLCDGFRSIGFVALNRAVVEGRLRCDGGRFEWRPRDVGDTRPAKRNERVVAFEAISATFRGGVGLGWSIEGAVDFTDAHTTYLADRPTQDWPARRSYLSGFSYERYAAISMQGSGEWEWKARARWLANCDPATSDEPGDPGPWEQAAQTLKNHGDSVGSEQILMAYLRTKRQRRVGWARSRLLRGLDRIFNDWFRGYGYRPLRALIPLALLVLAVAGPLLPARANHVMRATDPAGVVYTPQGELSLVESGQAPPETCGQGKVRCFNPWLYAVDTVVPIVDLKQRSAWSPSSDAGGGLMLAWVNTATLAGWAISSLLVVGLARAGSRSLN
ncbi:hypothetical protein OG558_36170 [Kribbella sp. NBC_01510]|uniref:hypothetical protein n=1 Tax=Kribbella sp. NBC_01510 TaxID=2903581 RepID=UPI00386712A1